MKKRSVYKNKITVATFSILLILLCFSILNVIGCNSTEPDMERKGNTTDKKGSKTISDVDFTDLDLVMNVRKMSYINYALIGYRETLMASLNKYMNGTISNEDLESILWSESFIRVQSMLLPPGTIENQIEDDNLVNADRFQALAWNNISGLVTFIDNKTIGSREPLMPRSVTCEQDSSGQFHFYKDGQEISEEEVLSIFNRQIDEDIQKSNDALNRFWDERAEILRKEN